jgi:nucleotide-binding universal stress UspA family protein
MYKHILVPVDGSPTSLHAVDQAIAQAKAFGSRVSTVFVIDPYPFTGVGTDFAYGQTNYLEAANAEAKQAVDAAKARLDAAGVPCDTAILESHVAWRGIVEHAVKGGMDLIVMGSHGRSGLEKLMLGSTTQRVLGHVKIPVLVVRDD